MYRGDNLGKNQINADIFAQDLKGIFWNSDYGFQTLDTRRTHYTVISFFYSLLPLDSALNIILYSEV